MQKILITGGAGNIGSSLVASLLQKKDVEVYVFDNFITGTQENLPIDNNRLFTFNCDINNNDELIENWGSNEFNYIFHYAALVGVERTQNNPLGVLDDVKGIRNVLERAKESQVKRIFYSSSSEVYGEPVEIPQNEDTTPLNSRVPYAVVKNLGEAFFRSYFKEYGIPFTIFRFFNTYGPNQNNDFVITKFIEQCMKGQKITIYGDGSQSRSFLHIDDNIAFTNIVLEKDLFINEVVNVGSDDVISIKNLALLIKDITESDSELVFLPPLKDGDMYRRKPDVTKMRLHMNTLTPLDKGITKTIDAS
jgi:nucleoside-diphosphate-sugar epimerase